MPSKRRQVNDDFRVRVGFLRNRKIRRLRHSLGSDAVLALLDLWGYTAEQRPLGTHENTTAQEIEEFAEWSGEPGVFVDTLLQIGLLDQIDGGFHVHDWAEEQPWAIRAPMRKKRAQIAAAARWEKRNKPSPTDDNAGSIPLACSKDATSNAQCNAPLLSSPLPSGDREEARSALAGSEDENRPVSSPEPSLSLTLSGDTEKSNGLPKGMKKKKIRAKQKVMSYSAEFAEWWEYCKDGGWYRMGEKARAYAHWKKRGLDTQLSIMKDRIKNFARTQKYLDGSAPELCNFISKNYWTHEESGGRPPTKAEQQIIRNRKAVNEWSSDIEVQDAADG